MNNQEELRRLIARYNSNEATEEERLVLEHWYSTINMADTDGKQVDHIGDELRLRIEQHIPELSFAYKSKKSRFKNWMLYVAALLVMAITFTMWNSDFTNGRNSSPVEVSIHPGGYKATLEIEGGAMVDLKADQYGIQTRGEVSYFDGTPVEGLDIPLSDSRKAVPVFVLKTPKGGMYKVSLPDSSQVWLNAGSSLRYPAQFESDRRYVELEGEAYFDIKEVLNGAVKKPFVVKNKHQAIEVLGTKFNVQAYSEDLKATTTLLEGRVKVNSLADKQMASSSVFLQPGDQSTFDGRGFKLLKSVNVEEAIAWKNGLFVFKDASLRMVMKQIERWYDVEVEYKDCFSDELFNGKVYRDTKLTELLEILSFSNIDFKLEGRKIIIDQKGE